MSVSFDNVNAAQLRTFGKSMIFTPSGGAAETITGIDLRTPVLEGARPGNVARAWAQRSDLSQDPARGDGWQMDSTGFLVEAVDEDGAGGIFVSLRKAG